MPRASRISPPVALAVALPLLLALVVAGFGIWSRATSGPDTGPLALPGTDAPQARSPQCDAVLGALPGTLPGGPEPLAPRELDPAVPGARAWAADPDPVVLRCGTPRPAGLGPASALVVVNGVDWLQGPAGTYVAVDRDVYLQLSTPAGIGPGPLQAVSDAITAHLPPQPVRVR